MAKEPRKLTAFALELRKWRGRLQQKEAAAIMGVSVWTYRNWEYGINEPAAICKRCLQHKMMNPTIQYP